jgi:hypothetical protein
MKNFQTWMKLRESDSGEKLFNAYRQEYTIHQEKDSAEAIVSLSDDSEETVKKINELNIGNNEFAHGILHVFTTYGEEHYDEGGMMAGRSLDSIQVLKSEIIIVHQEDVEQEDVEREDVEQEDIKREATDEDLRVILKTIMSKKSYLDSLVRE